MRKKLAASMLLMIALFLVMGGTAVAGQNFSIDYKPVLDYAKDETIYINLFSSGKISRACAVNRIDTKKSGLYTDYGEYEEIINLTNEKEPKLQGDEIAFSLDADRRGFYYEGVLKNAQPPYVFDIKYSMDGVEYAPDAILGKSGNALITVEASPNSSCAEYFRKNYFCQIQADIDLDTCKNITAEGASQIVTGRVKTLAFTVLPEKTAKYEIGFLTDSFEFNGFTMSCLLFDADKMLDLDIGKIKDDTEEMADGTRKLVDGTSDLKDGLSDLSAGVSDIYSGAKKIKNGMEGYKQGLADYTKGIEALCKNADTLAGSMRETAANAKALKNGYGSLKNAVKAVFSQIEPMAPPELSAQLGAISGELDAYGSSLDAFASGLSQMADGMEAFAAGLSKAGAANDELLSGFSSLQRGVSGLAGGLSKLASNMKKLPGEVKKLLDGQTELMGGIDEATGMFDDMNAGSDGGDVISFVSEKNNPGTVQFIYKSDGIIKEVEKKDNTDKTKEEKSLLERFTDLFR